MAINSYVKGTDVRIVMTVKDMNGNLADPTTLGLTYKAPDGTETTKAISDLTHDSLGQYHFDITAPVAGTWSYYAVATVPGVANQSQFIVVDKIV